MHNVPDIRLIHSRYLLSTIQLAFSSNSQCQCSRKLGTIREHLHDNKNEREHRQADGASCDYLLV